MEIEGVAGEMIAVAARRILRNDATELGLSCGGRRSGEEGGVHSRAIGRSLGGERIFGNDSGQFFVSANHDVHRSARQFLKASGDRCAYPGSRARCVEDGVSALDIGCDIAKAEPLEYFP